MVTASVDQIEDNIRELCLAKRIRPSEFFLDFDRLRSGYVTDGQFFRVLFENLGLKFDSNEERMIAGKYNLRGDGRLNYKAFCNVINQPFNARDVRNEPAQQVQAARELLGTGRTIRPLSPASEDRLARLLQVLAEYYQYRGINLRTSCEDFDVHHMGIIQQSQFYRSFPRPPQLADEDLELITRKYNDHERPGMVNYLNFHHDIVSMGKKVQLDMSESVAESDKSVRKFVPEQPPGDIPLQSILDKLRIAVHKNRVRTKDFFMDYDKLRSGVVTEHQFLCGLSLAIGKEAQLTRAESQKVVEFYREADGRVRYKEFTEMLENAFNITELEKKPLQAPTQPPSGTLGRTLPKLSDEENQQVRAIISRLAYDVNRRRLLMYPYFKDFDRSTAYSRVVTPDQFGRVLRFLELHVTPVEQKLLCKQFADNWSGDVNYPAFVQCVDKDFVNYAQDDPQDDAYGKRQDPAPAEPPKDVTGLSLDQLLIRIRHHIYTSRLRLLEHFQDFDTLRSGQMTKDQFRRCLSDIGISSLGQFNMNEGQFYQLCQRYQSAGAKEKVCYVNFMNDIESIFTQPELEKNPLHQVPPSEVYLVPKPGTGNWDDAQPHHKEAVQATLERIKGRVDNRRVLIKPTFQDFDKHNNGHVTRVQFRQCLSMLELPLREDEMLDLEARFCDDVGFDYLSFLKYVQPELEVKPMYIQRLQDLRKTNEKNRLPERRAQGDLEAVLQKIKRKVFLERIRIHEWMHDFDKLRSGRMLKGNFRRCLDLCKFELRESELAILEDHYQFPHDKDFVEWLPFSRDIESIFTTDELEKTPLIEPEPYKPVSQWTLNKLEPENEYLLNAALERVAEKVRKHRMQLFPLFEDYDRVNNGTVTRSQFRRVLNELELAALVPGEQEWVCLWRKFGVDIGGRDDVNYIAFCDTVYTLGKFEWRKP